MIVGNYSEGFGNESPFHGHAHDYGHGDTGKYGEGDIIQMFHDAQVFVGSKGVPESEKAAAYALIDQIRQMTAAGNYHEAQVAVSRLPNSQGDAVRQATYDAIERVRQENTGGSFLSAITSPISSVIDAAESAIHFIPGVSQAYDLAKGVAGAVTQIPGFDMLRTGVSFIPGVGQAVSGALSAAAAFGQGKSLKDAALAAAKGAIPGGPAVQAAFDIAHGAIDGQNLVGAALGAVRDQVPGGELGRAAFDAGRAIAEGKALDTVAVQGLRSQLGSSGARDVFDKAIQQYRGAKRTSSFSPHPQLSTTANGILRTLSANRGMTRMRAVDLGSNAEQVRAAKQAIAARMNALRGSRRYRSIDVGDLESLEDCCAREGLTLPDINIVEMAPSLPPMRLGLSRGMLHGLYRTGHPMHKAAIQAHGFLPRVAHYTGELTGAGQWTLRAGDTGAAIAAKLTGDGNRWKDLLGANPGVKVVTAANGTTQLSPWNPGQVVQIPSSWLGTAAPVPSGLPTGTPPTLKQGSKGDWVRVWQQIAGATVDGDFGPKTTASTKAWQKAHGLLDDGVVGPKTWGKALPQGTPTSVPAVQNSIPAGSDLLAAGATQLLLASFFQRHSAELPQGAPVAPLFGTDPSDLAGQWNARSIAAMQAFQAWKNAHLAGGQAPLPVSGQPDQVSINALRDQVQADLSAATGINIPIPAPPAPAPPVVIAPPQITVPPPAPTQQPPFVPTSYTPPTGTVAPGGGPPSGPGTVTLPEIVITPGPGFTPGGGTTTTVVKPPSVTTTTTAAGAGGGDDSAILWLGAIVVGGLLLMGGGKRKAA
jgi:peptidoglycan hydrolase-like protein with peptidoglycan-binding domain